MTKTCEKERVANDGMVNEGEGYRVRKESGDVRVHWDYLDRA